MTDLTAFINSLKTMRHPDGGGSGLAAWFNSSRPIHIARAPGRLDVMGGIADYAGSLVLETPIAQAALCAVQLTDTQLFEATSFDASTDTHRVIRVPLTLLDEAYDQARAYFAMREDEAWGAYVFGPLHVLHRECNIHPIPGIRIVLSSSVPEGKGVSSSAAIEVAALRSMAAALNISIEGRDLALMCQKAENLVAGSPCGVMDQMTIALGRERELLAMRCQPAQVLGYRRLPDSWRVWGIDSGVRHAVSGSDYASVRAAVFMGYRYIAQAANLPARVVGPGLARVEDEKWNGYAANITPSEFEMRFRQHLPEQVSGRTFLDQLGGITDDIVRIDPSRQYAVRQCVAHPIHEHARVRLFAQLLKGPANDETARLLGELMFQSHASYSACGLGSNPTDDLVRRVREVGPEGGLFGAKITGGGCGGVVAVLGRHDADEAIRRIAKEYQQVHPAGGFVFTGSSPGAMQVAVRTIAPAPH